MVKKKGIFYTVTALLMMGVFIFSFFSYSTYKMRDSSMVIGARITSLDDFMKDIERDIERGVYISSFRTLLGIVQYVSLNQTYIDNFDSRFNEAFFNGTIYNMSVTLLEDNSFSNWKEKIIGIGQEADIEIYFFNESVIVWQEDPWNIKVKVNFLLGIGDIKGTAYWMKDMEIIQSISILNFEDPLYRINTQGIVLNAIRINNTDNFVDANNDTTNLQYQVNGSYYIAWNQAPSYLQRLEGNFSASEYGIESLVNLQILESQGLSVYNKTVVDYIYFDNNSDPTEFNVQNMPSWFRLDNETNGSHTHLEIYEVNDLTQ